MKKLFFTLSLLCLTYNTVAQQTLKFPTQSNGLDSASLLDDDNASEASHARLYPVLLQPQDDQLRTHAIRQEIEVIKNKRKELLRNMYITCGKTGAGLAVALVASLIIKQLPNSVFASAYSNYGPTFKCIHIGWVNGNPLNIHITPVLQKLIGAGVSGLAISKLVPASADFILYKQLSMRQQELENILRPEQKPTAEQLAMQARYAQLAQETEQLKGQLGHLLQKKKLSFMSECTIV